MNNVEKSPLETLVDSIKETRVLIDLGIKTIEARWKFEGSSHEARKAYDALLLSKAWLGKALGYIGTPNPYKVVDKVEDIPPTADTAELRQDTSGLSRLQFANYLREACEHYAQQVTQLWESLDEKFLYDTKNYDHISRSLMNSLNNAQEARFWYGFVLQHLREENEGK